MFSRNPSRSASSFGFGMSRGPVPPDIIVLLAVVFVTFALQFFGTTQILPEFLRLTPDVWRRGFVWQLLTYPFIGRGGPSLWFLLELFILFLFARDVFSRLQRKNFWRLIAWATLTASLAAVAVELLTQQSSPVPFSLLQGQRTLLVIVIAAFATLYGNVTIYLFFVLPIQARWFLWIEILFAFMGFLGTRDLGGFVGLVAAVGITYNILTAGSLRRMGRELWLRFEHQRIRLKLLRMRRRRGMRLVRRDNPSDDKPPNDRPRNDKPDRWVN